MIITRLEQDADDPDRVRVHVDGAYRIALPAEVVLSEGLRPGEGVTEERLAGLERRDQAWRAREAALVLLAYRARSAEELRRRLERKGFDAEVARACVDALGEMGMVNDAAFAESFVRDRIRLRPHGRRRLSRELRAKGVDAETASAALDEVMEGEQVDDVGLARQAAARWHPRPGEDDARARRRLYGFLARRGFGADAIRQVLEEKLG